jgi:hypothetical protein
MIFSESYEQRRLIAWLELHRVPHDAYTAIPHGGRRDPKTAALLKLEGVRPGAPDILFYTSPPIALEMKKAKGGRVSPAQKAVHERLRRAGWAVLVCHGAEEAKVELAELPQFRDLLNSI